MQKISQCLWFDTQAEEAAKFYVSLFPNSAIDSVTPKPDNVPGEPGVALVVNFHLNGQEFMGLNGGPHFRFTEAISMMVHCEIQAEIDRYWSALTEGGEESQCGWLKDKYGLSWQIVPTALGDLMKTASPEQMKSVMDAVMQMVKFDISKLQEAYEGA